ncbi:hypothetical protein [Bacillus cereus group sp. N3]|uniref:hypothetical protein n=1 Tax=Bacillus cereus group sp. N3 TaxID=2794582 RepID=UPI0018F5FFF8|nr:hypothetical protein [Bacillus cereus group sp. N3]MBJ8133713.1 hypothetical protein [Bacillus cereus group sp. N3]
MNIFQIKTKPHGNERLNDFVQRELIAIGWPGIGDLNGISKEELRKRLENEYSYKNSRSLGNDLGNVWSFYNTMNDGDIVMFQGHVDNVYIVKVGPYKYVAKYDNAIGMAHQRDFELLKVMKKHELNPKVQELLRNRSSITMFKYPIEEAELDFINIDMPVQQDSNLYVDGETMQRAMKILKDGLNSSNEEIRFQAAVELLRYAK